ncbi:MAG TPA: EAL domain-containing protein [Longimicrobiaceae bacterium]
MTALPARSLSPESDRRRSPQEGERTDILLRLARFATSAPYAGVYLVQDADDEQGRSGSLLCRGLPVDAEVVVAQLARQVVLRGEPFELIRTVDRPDGEATFPRSFLGVPFSSQAPAIHGCLYVMDVVERRWTPEQRLALQDLATLTPQDLLAEVGEQERRALETVVRVLAKAVDNLPLGVTVTDLSGRIVYTNPAEARMHGYSVEEMIGMPASVLGPPEHRQTDPLKPEEALSWTRETVNVRKDGSRFEVRLWSDVVTDASGEPVGLVTCCEDVTDRRRTERRLLDVAMRDPLTGLPNRTLFYERLSNAIEKQRKNPLLRFAVLFLDLDRFKIVNDSLGHHVGDQLLRVVASRLLDCVRPGDTVARFGGDEFAILLENTGAGDTAIDVANRTLSALSQPVQLGGYEIVTSASVGVVQSATHMTEADYIWQAADMAMYRAKSAGPGRYEVFDREMHREAVSRLRLESDLRRGLETGQFRIDYQPIIELGSNAVVGFEALVRWDHPELGELHPNDFIAVAEETGLILKLGQWVLSQACREARSWEAQGDSPAPWVAVNLSVKQLGQRGLADRVREALRAADLPPRRLRLEITEASVMVGAEAATETLQELRALETPLVLDDFGTGLSSLRYLDRLPIAGVKIDRSLVEALRTDGRRAKLVEGVIRLARDAGLRVIAEGVSYAEELDELRRLGCDEAQGYLISPPLAAQAVQDFFAPSTRRQPANPAPLSSVLKNEDRAEPDDSARSTAGLAGELAPQHPVSQRLLPGHVPRAPTEDTIPFSVPE